MELRRVEDRGRPMRNARSVAVDGRICGDVPPRFSGGLPGRYEPRLLPTAARRVPTPTLGATIRIGCMPQPVCLSRTGDDLPHSDPSERIPPAPDLPCSAGGGG